MFAMTASSLSKTLKCNQSFNMKKSKFVSPSIPKKMLKIDFLIKFVDCNIILSFLCWISISSEHILSSPSLLLLNKLSQ